MIETIVSLSSIAASLATVMALGGIYYQVRATANDKSARTIDVVFNQLHRPEYAADRAIFLSITGKENGALERLAGKSIENAYAVRRVLNVNEMLALSVFENLVDEYIFKKYWRRSFENDYIRAKKFIELERVQYGNKLLYEHFEKLAKNWLLSGSN
jgi:Domain of unknown function (DUF4760)